MAAASTSYPLYKKEDTDAFFTLFQNNLANFVIISATMLSLGFPASLVFGKVIPGAAVAVMAGNLYYAFQAKRLAAKEGRTDVTALAYGISTPVMFVFLFGVLAPALQITGDPILAFQVGLAACFLSGLIEVLVSFSGNWITHHLPRAAMLGALAGVGLTFIAGEMLFEIFAVPSVGLVALMIILLGTLGKMAMPFRIPASLLAIIIGTALAFVIGEVQISSFNEALQQIGFYPFLPSLEVFSGFSYLFGTFVALLAVILPITLYNAIETMNNVSAMAAEGDDYDVRECQAVDGTGTILGTLFGGLFPTTVYVASIGAKWMGAGRGYSLLNGMVFTTAALFGLVGSLATIIPTAAVAPTLVFAGLSLLATAFHSNEKKYYPAVAIALLPYVANYMLTQFEGEGTHLLNDVSSGLIPLGEGAMFTGIILGALTVFIIDHKFGYAAIYAGIGMLLSFFGFTHAPELGVNAAPSFTFAYLLLTLLFGYYALYARMTLKQTNAPAGESSR
ncbi:AGZA family xanthine/uracil permease-like MFS transporter [Geomicrobium halophilum]|uniref:AGZA family xanthine/uracil permease-like MFS transporter n=1 Tax=Geomicrobium halophilum TaxID=549000 RepID=A0A841Q0J7_9BACL|nr:NCS2 family permease [Geomicrobium halophilum]MBB6448958.1 AGZA family xanthine/uracil permease-like MFS transporter [Geomicrobium halophilum]